MTESELARDKLKYWNLITRAKRVGFKIPEHWLKYGMPPTKIGLLTEISLLSILDKVPTLFD